MFLVILNKNQVKNYEKLSQRRLYSVDFCEYIRKLDKPGAYIQAMIAPENEYNFYDIKVSDTLPLFVADINKPTYYDLYRKLFVEVEKARFSDYVKYTDLHYMQVLEDHLKPFLVNNHKKFYYEQIHHYLKGIQLQSNQGGTGVTQSNPKGRVGGKLSNDAINNLEKEIELASLFAVNKVRLRGNCDFAERDIDLRSILQGSREDV